jgi:hypothetical protein
MTEYWAQFRSKSEVRNQLLVFQAIGFFLSIVVCWLTEVLDAPFAFPQVLFNTATLVILGTWTMYRSATLIARLRHLEGFFAICASCKHVRINERWIPVEEFMSAKSGLTLSHSICPCCTEKLYGEVFGEKRDRTPRPYLAGTQLQ